jgi:hypothetical protein
MALQSLILPIITLFRSAGVNAARNAIGGLGKDFNALAGNIGQAAGAFSAFQALAGTRQFLIGSVEVTQQFERNMLALGQVFESMTPKMERFTRAVEDYGIGQAQAAQASIFIGSVLKQYGFDVDQAADATQRIVKLAQDLATTYGYDVQEALLAVTALFRGEFDPIEKFGVAMKQSEINSELAARGLGHLEGAARENAEAIITLDFLFTRASDSVGAFTRAQDTLYAAQKRLEAGLFNLQIAFGDSLQEPIAALTSGFADLIEKHGPQLVDVSELIGEGIELITPLFVKLGDTVLGLVGILEPAVFVINIFATALNKLGQIVLTPINEILGTTNLLFDALRVAIENTVSALPGLQDGLGDFEAWLKENLPLTMKLLDFFLAGGAFRELNNGLRNFVYENDASAKATRENTNEQKRFELQAERSAEALNEIRRQAEAAKKPLEGYPGLLERLGFKAVDAENKLQGLAAIFGEIETEAEKSKAADALNEMGFEAGQIEEILTRPDWAQIFGEISRLAKIAATDIALIPSVTGLGIVGAAQGALDALRASLTGSGGGAVKDAVNEFFTSIDEEIAKESARRKLRQMGASEGLIEAIVGADGWEKVFQRVIRNGVSGLRRLQDEFNRTKAGIDEITDATKALEEAQQKQIDEFLKQKQKEIDEAQRLADELKAAYERARQAADNFLERLEDFNTIEILPNIEEEVGKFEAAVIGSVERIRSELKTAFRSELIFKDDFEKLSAFVAAEEFELRRLAKARDDLAKRYQLSEALISEYKDALTAGLQLTTLFGQLKNETEKRTVTEVQRGITKLAHSLREFEITVSKSYQETVEKVQDKTAGLLQGFRDMAQKSRDFAANLQKLRSMGLDPMLFDQLVKAGVVAGGETAQALVDGGSETINEINDLFTEINKLGAELGEEVATTMYGKGIDITNGLIAGIASEQEKLLQQARDMADAFSKEFSSRIKIAIEKPVSAAKAAADAAQAAVPTLPTIDMAGLKQLNDYITNATNALGKVTSEATKAGIQNKIDVVSALRSDVMKGGQFDLSGIARGLSSAELRAAAIATGSPTVNNTYNVTVQSTGNKSTAYAEGLAFTDGVAAANAANPSIQFEMFGR